MVALREAAGSVRTSTQAGGGCISEATPKKEALDLGQKTNALVFGKECRDEVAAAEREDNADPVVAFEAGPPTKRGKAFRGLSPIDKAISARDDDEELRDHEAFLKECDEVAAVDEHATFANVGVVLDKPAATTLPQLAMLSDETIADLILGGNEMIELILAKLEQSLGMVFADTVREDAPFSPLSDEENELVAAR